MKKMDEYGSMNAMKNEMKEPMNAMKMKAMKMPIRAMKNRRFSRRSKETR